MRQHLLARLLHAPEELDYVERFQALQSANLAIRDEGPSTTRLLQKSTLEAEVGNFAAALEAAQDASGLDPNHAQGHYQVGRCYVFLALAKADSIPLGPSLKGIPGETAMSLLERAREAFGRMLELSPDNAVARRDYDALDGLVDGCTSEASIIAALRETT